VRRMAWRGALVGAENRSTRSHSDGASYEALVALTASMTKGVHTSEDCVSSESNRPPTAVGAVRNTLGDIFDTMSVQILVVGVILVSMVCVIVETVPDQTREQEHFFTVMEKVVTCLFTLEITLRICIAERPCQYFVSGGNAVDILATLPWYIEYLMRKILSQKQTRFNEDFADAFQLIRLMRVLRLAKAARHSTVITTTLESVRGSLEGLSALAAFVCMGTVFAATVVFFLECEAPDTPFISIPAAVWWALPTVTGVGYGDMVPQTFPGKIAACCTMVGGVLITSLSVAVTTQSFMEHFQRNMQRAKVTQRLRTSMKRGQTDSASPAANLLHLSTSGQDLVGLVNAASGDQDAMIPRLPRIEDELHNLLAEVHATLEGGVGAPTLWPGSQDSGREALLTSLELLTEQSRLWFRQVQRVTDDIIRMELGTEENERSARTRACPEIGASAGVTSAGPPKAADDTSATSYAGGLRPNRSSLGRWAPGAAVS